MPSFFVLIVLIASFIGPVWGQDEGDLQRQIRLVKEEIQREEQLRQREQERDRLFAISAEERLKRLRTERAVAASQLDSLRSESARMELSRQKQRSTTRWYIKRHDDHRMFLVGLTDSVIAFVEQDFPYGKEERLRSLRSLREQLVAGTLTPEEGTDRLWAVLLNLLKVGGSVENWPGALATPEGELNGRFLRWGAVAMAFVSDNGREIRLLNRSGGTWEWKSVGDDLPMRSALREALKMSEGKSAPALVLLPIESASILRPAGEVTP